MPSDDNLQLHSEKLVSVESSKESSCLQRLNSTGVLWSHSTRNDIQLSARKEVGRSCCFCRLAWSCSHKSDSHWGCMRRGQTFQRVPTSDILNVNLKAVTFSNNTDGKVNETKEMTQLGEI
jgi:hypothetical protein